MRIRKHAKISGLLFSQTSGSSLSTQHQHLQTHVCQLNQSPWDVINFPPDSSSIISPYQVDKDDSFTGNGSFGDSIGAVESVASMKISVEDETEMKEDDGPNRVFSDTREDHLGFENSEIILCCKSDGKGWQCRREAREGHSLCEHHLAQLRNYNSLAHPGGSKKSDKHSDKGAVIRRRPRTKKASSVSNPHEFYYYSGFGPRWGKKRGTKGEPNVSSDTKLAVEPEATTTSSSLQIDDHEFDYVEEDDDDDDENGQTGKKRGRKPIKARSLKSLM